MSRCVSSRAIAIIRRFSHVRRFGTLRAIVVRDHEYFHHERVAAGCVAIEHTPERTSEHRGIFQCITAAAACFGGFHLRDVRDWRLRICGDAAEAIRHRQRLGAAHQRARGVGGDAAISSYGQRLARHYRSVGGKRGREREYDIRHGVWHGPVHGSGGDAQSGERDGYGDQPGESGRSASAIVTLQAAVGVSVLPATATVAPGGAQIFAASISGSGSLVGGVAWSVNGVAGGNATLGTIVVNGPMTSVYSAPPVIPSP